MGGGRHGREGGGCPPRRRSTVEAACALPPWTSPQATGLVVGRRGPPLNGFILLLVDFLTKQTLIVANKPLNN